MSKNSERPIIIRRRKTVAGGGHHGGAWKVAYADFVTAMMAFFLLMWLINATTEEQRKGIAEYFDSRIPLVRSMSGGNGAFGGEVMRSNLDRNAEPSGGRTQVVDGRASGKGALDNDPKGKAPPPAPDAVQKEEESLKAVQDAFEALAGESDVADPVMTHIRTRVTEEGLVIDVFDTAGRPLFESGSDRPTPMLRALLEMVASVAVLVTNPVAVTGHTDATPFVVDEDDGNWSLSTRRAQSARRLLVGAGLGADRIARVAGRAATQPMFDEDPTDPRNRRIEITLLRERR